MRVSSFRLVLCLCSCCHACNISTNIATLLHHHAIEETLNPVCVFACFFARCARVDHAYAARDGSAPIHPSIHPPSTLKSSARHCSNRSPCARTNRLMPGNSMPFTKRTQLQQRTKWPLAKLTRSVEQRVCFVVIIAEGRRSEKLHQRKENKQG